MDAKDLGKAASPLMQITSFHLKAAISCRHGSLRGVSTWPQSPPGLVRRWHRPEPPLGTQIPSETAFQSA
jgi:hypothetical protein